MEELDRMLASYPHDWSYERIGTTERALLRLALAEILFLGTAHKVVINEVLDLAKLYSQPESVKFINGILGAAVAELKASGRIGDVPHSDDTETAGEFGSEPQD
jgi:N utilization substance protein B